MHIGETKPGNIEVTVIDYNESAVQETKPQKIEECFALKDRPSVTWINLEGVHDVALVEKLGACFQIHPLTLEDILNTDHRPKFDDMENYVYMVLKMLHYDEKGADIVAEQVSLILGSNFVLSFQEGIKGDVFEPLRQRIRSGKGKIRKLGADYLAYAIVDGIVDNYFTVLEKLGEQIELLEEEVVTDPKPETLRKIHEFKREMLYIRRCIWPLREVTASLAKRESPLIKESTELYLRDVYDHLVQIMDSVETFREMLSSMLDIYLSSLSNRMNQVMKVLTIIATIFIPLTFLAGVYGMNFKYMPELEWHWGYPFILAIMMAVVCIMLFFFRKRKWL
ncbi:MAG: magnesium/cobalt transporter CorA [Syntrophales bacterium]|nr:magnesium/cobalt transporter CorA [Syntrophales bacterium]